VSGFEAKSPEQVLASLGGAADELRTTVEEKLYEIVEVAEARGHDIEDRALERALEIEQQSEYRAAELFGASAEGAEQMVVAIDSFERQVREALGSLRTRAAELATELEAAETREEVVEPTGEEDEGEGEPVPYAEAIEETAQIAEDVREGVRRRILDLFLAGRPRADAERLLGDIEDGGRYTDLIDEIYEPRPERQQGSRRRRGGRRRRRPGP
jgi:hypothetical protein